MVGLAGDGVALLDANRFTNPVLRGIPSGCVRRVALALSQGSTGLMEGLRAEDVERLPEPSVAYLENAPGAGRLDTLLTGLGSLRLAVEDALGGPALVRAAHLGRERDARQSVVELACATSGSACSARSCARKIRSRNRLRCP